MIEEKSNFAVNEENKKLIHDLSNCLSPILMQAQFLSLSAETVDADAVKKSAGAIERSAKEMISLLQTNNISN